jgi:predicted transposase/invertase (TIGR01784 family)
LPEEWRVKELRLLNVEQSPTEEGLKGVIFDIYCVGENGEHFIVEMQRGREAYFVDRSIYYFVTAIREQLREGAGEYRLLPVFYIGIMGTFKLENPDFHDEPVQEVSLKNQRNIEFFPKLRLFFVQLPLFEKRAEEIRASSGKNERLDAWLFTLKNLAKLHDIPKPLKKDPVFKKFYKKAAYVALEPEVRAIMNRELDKARRAAGDIHEAVEKTREEMEKVREEMEKAHEKAREEMEKAREELIKAHEEERQKSAAELAAIRQEADTERQKTEQKLKSSIQKLLTKGFTQSEIAETLDITPKVVSALLPDAPARTSPAAPTSTKPHKTPHKTPHKK